jgi:glycosyltransferase involved in cell wall biosynthesis
VAVVTPTLQMGRFIGETIDSVLAQDYPHIEYLVMDGGSTDGTREILEDRGVRYVSRPDGGQADAVNRGFEATGGELFTFLNADDTLLPGAITRMVEAFERNPDAGVVYGQADYVDEDGRQVLPYPTAPFSSARLGHECFICQPAALMTREAFVVAGRLDPGLQCALDYDLWLRIARRDRFVYLEEPLATSRMYPGNKSLGQRDTLYRESIALARREFGYVPMSWIAPYAAFRVEDVDQFTEQSRTGPRSRALALWLGLRANPRHLRRFFGEWQADGFFGLFPDGWMSKAYALSVPAPPGARHLYVRGRHEAQVRRPLILSVKIDGVPAGRWTVRRHGPFTLQAACPDWVPGNDARVELSSAWTWRPGIAGDVRRLSCLIDSVEFA